MKLVPKMLACLGKSSQTLHDDAESKPTSEPAPISPRTQRAAALSAANLPPIRRQTGSPTSAAPRHTRASSLPAGSFASRPVVASVDVDPGAVTAPAIATIVAPAAQVAPASDDPVKVFPEPGVLFAAPEQQRISADNRRLTMVTRWENNPRESDEENRIYGTFMANSIEKTAADLSSGEIGNLSQLWARARQARVESFLVQKKASKPEDLGNSLDQDYYRLASAERAPSTLTTGIGELGRYGYIHPAIHARLKAIGQKEHQTRKLSDPTEAGPAYAEWIDGDYKLVQCPANNRTDDAGENESVFGEYMLMVASPENPPSEEVNSRSMVLWSFQVGDVKSASGNFEQSDSGNFEDTFLYKVKLHNVMVPDDETRFVDTKAYARTNASFANALKATDRSEILDHAFEGYWNLVVAAPDARGSAAKSDYVLRSILLAKGIDLPPARAGLAPDLEAMSRSRPAWVQHARSVFDIE